MFFFATFAASLLCTTWASVCPSPDPYAKDDLGQALAWGTLNVCDDAVEEINDVAEIQKINQENKRWQLQQWEMPDLEEEFPTLNNSSVRILKRRRRIAYISEDPFLSCEMRYVFPISIVNYELKTFINFEIPFNFNLYLPFLEITPGGRTGGEHSQGLLSTLEELLDNLGIDGHNCLLRNICEVSSLRPMEPRGILKDLLGVAVKHIFKPGNEIASHQEKTSSGYLKAASHGRAGANCGSLYSECQISILGLIKHSGALV